jgi:hypothetical protein
MIINNSILQAKRACISKAGRNRLLSAKVQAK